MTTLSVVIGGNDVSSSIISLTTEQDICRVAQTFEVALKPTLATSFDPWDSVVIAINGTNRLTGYVNEVVKGRVPTEFVVRGMDKMKLALDMFVPNTWTSGSYLSEDVEVIGEPQDAGWWIDFWLGEAGITSSGSVETGSTVPVDTENPLVWTYTAVSDIIQECLGYAGGGYTVIVDGSGVAQIAAKTIGGGTTHSLTSTLAFSRSEDDSWLRDRAVVFGATSGSAPVVVEKPDDPSACTKAVALSSDLIKTEARAEEIAEAILDFFDDTLDIKRCEVVGDENVWLGHTASVSDSWTGYSGRGLITSIETSVDDRGFRQLVSVDEKCGFVWGWGIAVLYSHISYRDYDNDNLKYAYQSASSWTIETVDTDNVTDETSIALDSGSYPHISYKGGSANLMYYYKDADGWTIETVDSTGDVGEYSSIALDSNGYPHISYYDGTNYALKYAYKDASGWNIETVDTVDGIHTSIVLDDDSYPHISYMVGSPNYDLKYAYKDAGGWTIETVDSTGNCGYYSSIALDSDDYAHISYCDGYPDYDLRYAYKDVGGWNLEAIDSVGRIRYCSLALDSVDYPHISYSDTTNDHLRYAYKDTDGWHLETVGSDESNDTSLVLDADGYPHIGYYEYDNYFLKYAYQDAEGWHIETVDDTADVGEFVSLARG